MRVTVAAELCEGNAVCVALAPDVFAQEGAGIAHVIAGHLTPDQRIDVERAVDGCPRQALELHE